MSHTDSTADGLITYGVVLVNDPGYFLMHDGVSHAIPPGTLYRIDGRLQHETRGGPGLFAALIWDMPPAWDLSDFAAELLRDERFNIAYVSALAPDWLPDPFDSVLA